jgi:hypothetical protein
VAWLQVFEAVELPVVDSATSVRRRTACADKDSEEGDVRIVLGLIFWIGLFGTVRQWRYARTHGLPITLGEKLLLILALPLGLALQLAVEEAGFVPGDGTIVTIVAGLMLNGWAINRQVQRKTA